MIDIIFAGLSLVFMADQFRIGFDQAPTEAASGELVTAEVQEASTGMDIETDDADVYAGVIGQAQVVVELKWLDKKSISGRYFYRRYRHDIELTGSVDETGLIRLTEGNLALKEDGQAPNIELRGKATGYEGRWSSPDGKTLSVKLNHAESMPESKEDFLKTLFKVGSQYDYIRYADVGLRRQRGHAANGKQLSLYVDPISKTRTAQIETGLRAQTRELFNSALREAFWQTVKDYHACMITERASFESDLKVHWISQRILSFTTAHDYFCAAAHPDQDVFSKTIVVLDNGAQELALEDVLLVGDKARSTFGGGRFGSQLQAGGLRDKGDEDELLMQYRQTVFAPWLVNQFKVVHRREMSAGSCDYGSAEPWVYADWYLASDGIHLTPSYLFALAVCSDTPWAVITWKDVLANPGRLGATFARIQMGLRSRH